MTHHTQRFGGMAGDQDTLALSQQMPDQVSDGVCFSCAGRTLNQNAAVPFQLLSDPDLCGVCRFAEKHICLRRARGWQARRQLVVSSFSREDWRSFSHNVQQGPWQFASRAQVLEHSFNSRGKTQGPIAQENYGIAADARLLVFCV